MLIRTALERAKGPARTIALAPSFHKPERDLPASRHHDLRRVAPGACDSFEAHGAVADPDDRAGGERAEGRFAAAVHAGHMPIGRQPRSPPKAISQATPRGNPTGLVQPRLALSLRPRARLRPKLSL